MKSRRTLLKWLSATPLGYCAPSIGCSGGAEPPMAASIGTLPPISDETRQQFLARLYGDTAAFVATREELLVAVPKYVENPYIVPVRVYLSFKQPAPLIELSIYLEQEFYWAPSEPRKGRLLVRRHVATFRLSENFLIQEIHLRSNFIAPEGQILCVARVYPSTSHNKSRNLIASSVPPIMSGCNGLPDLFDDVSKIPLYIHRGLGMKDQWGYTYFGHIDAM